MFPEMGGGLKRPYLNFQTRVTSIVNEVLFRKMSSGFVPDVVHFEFIDFI